MSKLVEKPSLNYNCIPLFDVFWNQTMSKENQFLADYFQGRRTLAELRQFS